MSLPASYTSPSPGAKIIVVGAGAFGLSTAYALSLKSKYEVWVFDRDDIPTPDAASTDISKVVRMDYGDSKLCMQLMLEGLPLWRQWNKERAAMGLSPVYHETGAIFLSKGGQFSDYEKQSMQSIREAGYGHAIEELLTPESIVKRFPHFKDAVKNGYNIAYLNKEGGWCDSSEAIRHLYSKCKDNGVRFVLGSETGCFEKLHQESGNKVLGIQTKDKKIHLGDRVVIATGPWTASLINMTDKLVATGQIVVHFKPPPSSIFQKFKNQPVWSADSSRTGFYGFPINREGILKLACHSIGYLNPRISDSVSVPRTHTTNANDTIPIKALKEFRLFLLSFFPSTMSMDITFSRVCWYSDSMDSNFLIAAHPSYQNLIVASGDSGHGMKFLPIIGHKIARIVEGVDSDYSRSWGWRDTETNSSAGDAMRAGKTEDIKPLRLCDPANPNTRMCTPEELRAATVSKL